MIFYFPSTVRGMVYVIKLATDDFQYRQIFSLQGIHLIVLIYTKYGVMHKVVRII